MKVGICTYESESVVIRTARESGNYGTMDCPQCGRVLQLGPERCSHGSLIDRGKTIICESCRNEASGDSRTHHVSQEQVEAFIEPPISDKELVAQESTEVEPIDTSLMDQGVI